MVTTMDIVRGGGEYSLIIFLVGKNLDVTMSILKGWIVA